MNPTLLSVNHLVKRYGDQTVVKDLSFYIEPGECLGIIGPNGAGKTTTVRMCLGLVVPDRGAVGFRDPAPAPGTTPRWLDMPRDALAIKARLGVCLLYTSPSPRDYAASRMPSSA